MAACPSSALLPSDEGGKHIACVNSELVDTALDRIGAAGVGVTWSSIIYLLLHLIRTVSKEQMGAGITRSHQHTS
jgi:hypothetical protein